MHGHEPAIPAPFENFRDKRRTSRTPIRADKLSVSSAKRRTTHRRDQSAISLGLNNPISSTIDRSKPALAPAFESAARTSTAPHSLSIRPGAGDRQKLETREGSDAIAICSH